MPYRQYFSHVMAAISSSVISDLKFWSFPGGPREPTLYRNPVKRSFACQGGCYPWHGAPFYVPSDGHDCDLKKKPRNYADVHFYGHFKYKYTDVPFVDCKNVISDVNVAAFKFTSFLMLGREGWGSTRHWYIE